VAIHAGQARAEGAGGLQKGTKLDFGEGQTL